MSTTKEATEYVVGEAWATKLFNHVINEEQAKIESCKESSAKFVESTDDDSDSLTNEKTFFDKALDGLINEHELIEKIDDSYVLTEKGKTIADEYFKTK